MWSVPRAMYQVYLHKHIGQTDSRACDATVSPDHVLYRLNQQKNLVIPRLETGERRRFIDDQRRRLVAT